MCPQRICVLNAFFLSILTLVSFSPIISLFLPSSPPFLSLSILIHSNDFAAAYILRMILSYRCKFPTSYKTKWSGCAKVPRKMTTFSNELIFPATRRLFSSIPYMNPSITIYWAIQARNFSNSLPLLSYIFSICPAVISLIVFLAFIWSSTISSLDYRNCLLFRFPLKSVLCIQPQLPFWNRDMIVIPFLRNTKQKYLNSYPLKTR